MPFPAIEISQGGSRQVLLCPQRHNVIRSEGLIHGRRRLGMILILRSPGRLHQVRSGRREQRGGGGVHVRRWDTVGSRAGFISLLKEFCLVSHPEAQTSVLGKVSHPRRSWFTRVTLAFTPVQPRDAIRTREERRLIRSFEYLDCG